MDFNLTEDQKMIAETVASFVKKDSPVERMRKLREDPIGYDPAVWQQMGELGWLSLPFPESVGGFGGSMVEVALVLERLGSSLVPEPYLASVVLGGMAILKAGSEEQAQRWLPKMIEGSETLALAYAERQARFDVLDVATKAEKKGEGWSLSGEKVFVLNGHHADHIVVSARVSGDQRDAAGIGLFVLDCGPNQETEGLTVQSIKTMDGGRAAILRLENVEVAADRLLGAAEGGSAEGERGGQVLSEVMDLGAAAACAEGLGVAQRVLDMTVEYLKTRQQFDVPIGSFQALQHKAVDLFVEVQLCRSTAILAALRAEEEDADLRQRSVSAAKVQLAMGGKLVTQQGIQLHGGIGITDEHDIGLYFKRMHILNTLFGDEDFHTERFAALPSFTAGV